MQQHESDLIIREKDSLPASRNHTKILYFYLIYIFINALVLFKYGSRQHLINPWLLTTGYALFLLFLLFLMAKIRLKESIYKYLFFAGACIFLLFSVWLNNHVDKFALQVDRWSAMEACIKALFHHQYPYKAVDHLQGRSSNLPALIFIGIPFYLLGDVGYLQSFTFIVFVMTICHYFKSYKTRLWALLTIVLSSAYCYDLYVKSDIISNFIFMLLFVVLSDKYFRQNKTKDVLFNSIGSSILILTRLVTVIPLILVLLKRFLKMSLKNKGLFMGISLLFILLSLWTVFKDAGSWANFMNYNPFYLQNSQLPFSFSLLCILLAVICAFFVKDLEAQIAACTLILLMTVLLSLISKTIEFHGFHNSILNSRFDISYFNFVTPFLIFYIAILFDKITGPEPIPLK